MAELADQSTPTTTATECAAEVASTAEPAAPEAPSISAPLVSAMEQLGSMDAAAAASAMGKLSQEVFNNIPAKMMCGDAIELAVHGMRRHRKDVVVQVAGVKLCRNLMFRTSRTSHGAVSVVLEAMAMHQQEQGLNSEAVWTLLVLCKESDENLAVAEHMGRRIVSRAMTNFPQCKAIMSKGVFLQALFDEVELVNQQERLQAAAVVDAARESSDATAATAVAQQPQDQDQDQGIATC